MKKLIALLLLLTIAQANIANEIYDLMKDDLTHIVCSASGEEAKLLGDASEIEQVKKTDYFSFKSFNNTGYFFGKFEDSGYVNNLVFAPSTQEGKKYNYGNDSYEVIAFDDTSIVFRFEANKDQLRSMYQDNKEHRKLEYEWSINRISGRYDVRVERHVYIAEITETLRRTSVLKGLCEVYDPNVQKF